jgi:AhpD family alkylhydroperoxidase
VNGFGTIARTRLESGPTAISRQRRKEYWNGKRSILMPTGAQQYYEHNAEAMKPVRQAVPDMIKGFSGLHQATMKPGTLDARQKELIALGIGLALRCENCIYAHIRSAVKAGASREEILETAGVAVMMTGGPGYTYLPRVHEALEALAARGELSLPGPSP